MKERLKKARNDLHLSVHYVASVLGISAEDILNIESGIRDVTSDEIAGFSRLYGIPVDQMICGFSTESQMSDRLLVHQLATEHVLSDKDRKEMENLIKFRKQYREVRHATNQ